MPAWPPASADGEPIVMLKMSSTGCPSALMASTSTLSVPEKPAGGVPENCPLTGSKWSQLGSGLPFVKLASSHVASAGSAKSKCPVNAWSATGRSKFAVKTLPVPEVSRNWVSWFTKFSSSPLNCGVSNST